MGNAIAHDTGWTVKGGLDVYDKDGERVGYVDQASDAQGWMQVEALSLGLQRLWIPDRLINSVDDREVMVTLMKDEVQAGYGEPAARSTQVLHRDGGAIAVTSEAGGRDEEWVVADPERRPFAQALRQLSVMAAFSQSELERHQVEVTLGASFARHPVRKSEADVTEDDSFWILSRHEDGDPNRQGQWSVGQRSQVSRHIDRLATPTCHCSKSRERGLRR